MLAVVVVVVLEGLLVVLVVMAAAVTAVKMVLVQRVRPILEVVAEAHLAVVAVAVMEDLEL